MSHAYHQGLAGYSPDQILHDGCDECEKRGKDLVICLTVLDHDNFERAWLRAQQFESTGGIPNLSLAETNLLQVLYILHKRLRSPDVNY